MIDQSVMEGKKIFKFVRLFHFTTELKNKILKMRKEEIELSDLENLKIAVRNPETCLELTETFVHKISSLSFYYIWNNRDSSRVW